MSFDYFFFFNNTATTEIYPLPLPDALPISGADRRRDRVARRRAGGGGVREHRQADRPHAVRGDPADGRPRSEEHTSELQSRQYLVCRLLLEKKKKQPKSSPLYIKMISYTHT